jgi:ketosteroid isomerase-like protein
VSQENVEAMRRALDAVNRRDRAAWLAVCDPEAEDVLPREWPESAPARGSEAIYDLYVENLRPWDYAVFNYTEFMEAGTDRLVAHQTGELQGQASGAHVAWDYWQVGTFRDRKVLRIEWFADRADALKAVGLEE